MTSITKAIIPVAGWGTRRLPITKTIEKCMLPIGNRPLVDYIVQDCLAAGIQEIIFVISEGSTQLQDYYGDNRALVTYLNEHGKQDKIPLITPPAAVTFRYVTQPAGGRYGTAVPVALAAPFINDNESAVVLMGDDFLWNPDGSSEVARLLAATPHGSCSLLAAQVAPADTPNYGVIETDDQGHYVRIVEKPAPGTAPSNFINISKYILTKEVIDTCASLAPSPRGEYELPDAVNQFITGGGTVKVVPAVGQYLDGGSTDGWLHANRVVLGDE